MDTDWMEYLRRMETRQEKRKIYKYIERERKRAEKKTVTTEIDIGINIRNACIYLNLP